jgi:ribokinase
MIGRHIMADVVVLGSLNMDLVVRAPEMPRPGETIRGEQFTTIPGGKGANQAAAAARLGAAVAMVGRVGADAFGPVMLANLRAQRVDVAQVQSDPAAASGIAMIIVDAHGENSIVVAPGANGCVTMNDLAAARDLLAGARYLLMQFEIPLPVVRGAIDLAQELGLRVILNAAPAYPVPPAFLHGVWGLVANESEARVLTGVEVVDVAAARRAGQQLCAGGIPVVIITLGAQGALLVIADETTHVPARAVQVVDTTAAGDAFIGGLTVALLQGLPLAEAVRYATCAGTLATTVLGAQTSLPSAAQVDAFFQSGAPGRASQGGKP